jgi:hypothetical protein
MRLRFICQTLCNSYTQSYDQLSLGGEGLGQAAAAGASGIDAFKSGEGVVDTIEKLLQLEEKPENY